MPERFYFDLIGPHGAVEDAVGVEADDLEEAVAQARSVIDEMRDSGELRGAGVWHLLVRNAGGTLKQSIPLG